MQANAKPLRIGIVVGEVSGDTLGVELMRSFKARGIAAEFEGIGGAQMIAEGFNSLYPMERLSVMGLVEVMGRIKELFSIRDGLVSRWQENPVDIFIGIDAPDFNLRVSSQLKPLGMKTVQYVSPSVWAWRQSRVHGIRAAVDMVLCLFPFEVDFYHKHDVAAAFVGHPLAQQIPVDYDQQQAKQVLGISAEQPVIGLLPGSRSGEVSRLAPLLFDSAALLLKDQPGLKFVVPAINPMRFKQIEEFLQQQPAALQKAVTILSAKDHQGNIGRQVMAASDLVLLASGTATLECLLYGRPMVVVYKLHWLTYFIANLMVRIPYKSLPNILAGQEIVPELIQYDATPQRVFSAAKALWKTASADAQQHTLRQIHQKLQGQDATDPVDAVLGLISA